MVRHKARWMIVNITPYNYHCDHLHLATELGGKGQQQQLPTPYPPSSSLSLSQPQSQPQPQSKSDTSPLQTPSHQAPSFEKRHIYHALRTSIENAFGIAGCAITEDIHVKYIHSGAQIAIIKAPRDNYKRIRAALTLITTIHIHGTGSNTANSNNTNTDNRRHQRQELIPIPVVASVLSVNGSARTCKIAALRMLRKWFQENHVHAVAKNKNTNNSNNNNQSNKKTKKGKKNNNGIGVEVTNAALMALHHQMQEIYAMD